MRGQLARNELGNRINAAEQTQAITALQSAFRNNKARNEIAQNRKPFNPIDCQDKIRANKKTFQNQLSDYSERRPQPLKEHQAKKN